MFAFDRIFDDNATQTDVYEGTTKHLLDSVLDGYNATVFAYGATGCGKTHTITGTAQQPGIIFLTMQELFEKIEERKDKETEVTLSYLEIYNETIRDLLVPGGSKQPLMLREDSNEAVTVAGLTRHRPKDVQEVMDMIVQGNEYRTVSSTEANATSSRSHAVLQINVAQRDKNSSVDEPHTMATLSIIDLAGSERASATKNRGERLMEGANINKSLLALGSCINALCDPRKRTHVPYRNSKLTRLLKFSLGGNCKTVMIVCISPSSAHFDETQNTLRYANRAKNIQTKVTRNVFNVNRHVKDYLVKIDEQMAIIKELQAQQKDAEAVFFAKFRKQLEKRDGVAREGVVRLRAAYDNSAAERREKVEMMKKQRAVERRIGLLTAWLASFDAICKAREDEESMPQGLVAMRKTAKGILVELENSRHHLRQKLEKCNWERAIDTALQHSIRQMPEESNDMDCGEIASLTREAELLKSNFAREAYREVMEQEKGADSAMLQVLMTAQFEALASLSDLIAMDEAEAVDHAKKIITRLLEAGYSAASHVIKPDGTLMPVDVIPPSKRGMTKRKRPSALKDASHPSVQVHHQQPAATSVIQEEVFASPMKKSPRRRKAPLARKGVSFTPKKKSPAKRSVRWRDDEESGPLEDFASTPQKFTDGTPPAQQAPAPAAMPVDMDASPERPLVAPEVPAYLNGAGGDSADDSSPSLVVPEVSSLSLPPVRGSNRFQAGFLSKAARTSADDNVSHDPAPQAGDLSSDEGTPLRPVDRNTLSPPHRPSRTIRPGNPIASTLGDENDLPGGSPLAEKTPVSGTQSDSESAPTDVASIDAVKLRAALHSAKRSGGAGVGGTPRLLSGTTSSAAKRVSVVLASSAATSGTSMATPSSGGLGGSVSGARVTSGTGSNAAGNSARHGRRMSPPIACGSPEAPSSHLSASMRCGSGTGALTAGQARRMALGGSMRWDGAGSPVKGGAGVGLASADAAKARRMTIAGLSGGGSSAAGTPSAVSGVRKDVQRQSIVWR